MYQALYRKWRPRVFSDVYGQSHITQTLKNELEAGHIAHAYLFTGSRGTGKTTCAKIMAKAVNCLHPVDGEPCNECESCRGIDNGSNLDVAEIDAASNNGVDNIRELREEAGYTPAGAKYRVYIIDEAHMLSVGAFNALLKTLEEPPAHVIFILATTEVHKIPATILSRCQRFDFRRIPAADIAARLRYIASQEHLEITEGAASMIAGLSDGALRDAISLLEECAGVSETIDETAVSAAAGLTGGEYLYEMAKAVMDRDAKAVLLLVDRLYAAAKDGERLCEELLNTFRNIMVWKAAGNGECLNLSPDDQKRLSGLADGFSNETVIHILDSLQDTLEHLHRNPAKRVTLELGLLRLCNPSLDSSGPALLRRVAALEEKLGGGGFAKPLPRMPKEEPAEDAAEPEQPAPDLPAAAEKEPEPVSDASADEPLGCWPEVLETLARADPPFRGVLDGSSAIIRGNHVLVDAGNGMFADLVRQQSHRKSLVEAVRTVTGTPYKVGIFKKSLEKQPVRDDGIDELARNAAAQGIEVREVKERGNEQQ